METIFLKGKINKHSSIKCCPKCGYKNVGVALETNRYVTISIDCTRCLHKYYFNRIER